MLQNLHTHSTFCDGKNTPREMIEAAIRLGFDSLGFSGHAPTAQDTEWEIKKDRVWEYKNEILSLKDEYADRIKIYLGLELDRYSIGLYDKRELAYTIGSAHMARRDGAWYDFDHCAEEAKRAIDELFCKDALAYARSYYETVVDTASVLDFDIVGHFDLLTKFSEKAPELIPIDSKEYQSIALEALHAVREKKEIFEVNTGAISRGHRTTPYPAPFILDEMKASGCKLVLTSDCHAASGLDCGFKEAREYIKAHGFDTLYYLTDNGFIGEKI